MALIQGGARANGTAEVVDGHLQVAQEHTPPGFVPFTLVAVTFSATAAEGLVSMQAYRDYVASGAAATSFAVTAGKKLKITSWKYTVRNSGAAQMGGHVALRVNPTGAVAVGSAPIVGILAATVPGAIAGMATADEEFFDHHVILGGTQQIGVTQIGIAGAGHGVVVRGYEYTE